MSWGVLHHTPSTRAGFERVAALVKPGGTLYVMVYRPAPLLRGRAPTSCGASCGGSPTRSGTTRAATSSSATATSPTGRRCFVMVAHHDPKTSTADAQTMQFGLFDAYSPRWNYRHSAKEVVTWFRDSGFREVTVVDPGTLNVRVRGTRVA